jgi:acyl carrier protein
VADEPIRTAALAAELIGTSVADSAAALWEQAAVTTAGGLGLTELRAAAASSGYRVALAGPAASGIPGMVDVVLRRSPADWTAASWPDLGPARPGPLGWANDVAHPARVRVATPVLQSYLRERLPERSLPAHLVVVRTWPVAATGMVAADLLPRPRRASAEAPAKRPPQTRTEHAVVRIWADVLGIDQIGLDDDFFSLGGHSLMAADIVERVRSELGLDLPLGQLFEQPTVAGVAEYLSGTWSAAAEPAPAITRIDRGSYRDRRIVAGKV